MSVRARRHPRAWRRVRLAREASPTREAWPTREATHAPDIRPAHDEAYKDTGIPEHCSLCFLVAKPGSTAKRLVVDYCKLNKIIKLYANNLLVMENTIGNAVSCKFKCKMDKRSVFWQVDLTERAKELMAFWTPNERVFRWLVMVFGIADAPTLFQELMNQCSQS